MKIIYIVRHGDWDIQHDQLTKEAEKRGKEIAARLPDFVRVVSSPRQRAIQTAGILSKDKRVPEIDHRADIPEFSEEQLATINAMRDKNEYDVAGVIFGNQKLEIIAKKAGQKLLSLVRSEIKKLTDGEAALIISHDGTMVALDKIITGKSFSRADKTFKSFKGMIIDEDCRVRYFGF